eukprot:Pgem_evm5s19198
MSFNSDYFQKYDQLNGELKSISSAPAEYQNIKDRCDKQAAKIAKESKDLQTHQTKQVEHQQKLTKLQAGRGLTNLFGSKTKETAKIAEHTAGIQNLTVELNNSRQHNVQLQNQYQQATAKYNRHQQLSEETTSMFNSVVDSVPPNGKLIDIQKRLEQCVAETRDCSTVQESASNVERYLKKAKNHFDSALTHERWADWQNDNANRSANGYGDAYERQRQYEMECRRRNNEMHRAAEEAQAGIRDCVNAMNCISGLMERKDPNLCSSLRRVPNGNVGGSYYENMLSGWGCFLTSNSTVFTAMDIRNRMNQLRECKEHCRFQITAVNSFIQRESEKSQSLQRQKKDLAQQKCQAKLEVFNELKLRSFNNNNVQQQLPPQTRQVLMSPYPNLPPQQPNYQSMPDINTQPLPHTHYNIPQSNSSYNLPNYGQQAPPPQVQTETRIAPDGKPYTRAEFMDYFGQNGATKWDQAHPAPLQSAPQYHQQQYQYQVQQPIQPMQQHPPQYPHTQEQYAQPTYY